MAAVSGGVLRPRASSLSATHAVLLLGWAGASPKAHSKYVRFFESRGFQTLPFVAEFKPAAVTLGVRTLAYVEERQLQ